MKTELLRLIDDLSSPDQDTAWNARDELEMVLTPQGLVFDEGSPECIPLMLELALEQRTVLGAELMHYLASVYCSAMGTWRRVRSEADAERRSVYDKGVAWEESVAAGYAAVLPRVLALAQGPGDTPFRGACVFLLGGATAQRHVLVPALQQFFDHETEEPLKIEAVEAVANLGAGSHGDDQLGSAVEKWLRLRLDDTNAGIRLGTALSLLARVEADERDALLEVVVDSRPQGAPAVDEAMWLSGKGIGWALDRRLRA
ncbi:hypothetical protein ACIRL2_44110 [Embleya sp. NPDC127516]|uniref:hypothetical protein n=1 Tax=Embleya sp. NPDC127516 TaxID=3363990 RepID=UPI0037F3EE71